MNNYAQNWIRLGSLPSGCHFVIPYALSAGCVMFGLAGFTLLFHAMSSGDDPELGRVLRMPKHTATRIRRRFQRTFPPV